MRGGRDGKRKFTLRRSNGRASICEIVPCEGDSIGVMLDEAQRADERVSGDESQQVDVGAGYEACDDGGNDVGYEACDDGDDAANNDSGNDIGYEACDDGDDAANNDEDELEENDNTLGIDEEGCEDLTFLFGEAVRNDGAESDEDSGDEIWNDANIPDPLSCDDDENRENRENDPIELKLGKTFGCADDFKLALLEYSLRTRYDIKLYKSTTMSLGAKCSSTDSPCPWRVYCSYEKRKRKMQIKVMVNEHICCRSGYSKMLKRSTIVALFSERLRLNPRLTKYEMASEIKGEYNLIVTAEQCGKAKTKVVKDRRATHEAQFARIWDDQAEIFKSNRGSTMEVEIVPGPTVGSKQRFYRTYICFKSQKETWKQTCRPIIGVDGAFLKWDVKGHLLAAVGRDGDNRIVPIAWVVVEIENDVNWDWFIRLLSVDLELGEGSKISIISDKQKDLVKSIHNVLPQVEQRMCARHIMDNLKKDIHDVELKRIFWRIARSYTMGDYVDNMEALRKYSPGAYASLLNTNPQSWSRAFFRVGSWCNDNLNNLSELLNKTIREARRKPLLDLLEDIRRQCMVRHTKRKTLAGKLQSRFTKKTHAEIEKMIEESKDCIRYMATYELHEVEHHGVNYRVDMRMKTCGCIKWQMTGIPCAHATCVILTKKLNMDDYVSDFYTTKMWRLTYNKSIEPVQRMKLWPRTNRLHVMPPPWRLGKSGRPRNYDGSKSSNETASSSNKTKLSRALRVVSCSNCKEEGHNILTCSNPSVEPAPKRPRGRPRKDQGSQQGASQGQGVSQGKEASQGIGSQGQGASQGLGSQEQGAFQV